MVIGPAHMYPDVSTTREIFNHGRLDGLLGTPDFVKQTADQVDLLSQLRDLEFVHIDGAMPDRITGDLLCEYTSVGNVFGTTELGLCYTRPLAGADWHWYEFIEQDGLGFEQVDDAKSELVVRLEGTNSECHHVFTIFPDLNVFHTKDLFAKHPTNPRLWSYAGRADDVVMSSCSDGVQAPVIESKLEQCRAVQRALVGGTGKAQPWLLLELDESITRGEDKHWVLDLFQYIQDVNSTLSPVTKIAPGKMLIAAAQKPMIRTVKLAIDRKRTIEQYKDEIEGLYSK